MNPRIEMVGEDIRELDRALSAGDTQRAKLAVKLARRELFRIMCEIESLERDDTVL